MEFGSLAWNAYYHGRNKGCRPIGDRATRSRKALSLGASRKGIAAWDQQRNEEMALDSLQITPLDLDRLPDTLKRLLMQALIG
jgi:hypothetical protein